ncbi:hypothetical protein PT277_03435 [Acetobacteraceae bacterium ESL0709]|nr:hypothetical protein [Acetobacteraceae bacterium ESL0709]
MKLPSFLKIAAESHIILTEGYSEFQSCFSSVLRPGGGALSKRQEAVSSASESLKSGREQLNPSSSVRVHLHDADGSLPPAYNEMNAQPVPGRAAGQESGMDIEAPDADGSRPLGNLRP